MKETLLAICFFAAFISVSCIGPQEEDIDENRRVLAMNVSGDSIYCTFAYSMTVSYEHNDTLETAVFDTDGNTVRVSRIGLYHEPNFRDYCYLDDGSFVFYGVLGNLEYYYGSMHLTKISGHGELLWQVAIDGYIDALCPYHNGFLLAGSIYIYNDSSNTEDARFQFYSDEGLLDGAITSDAGKNENYNSMSVDAQGNIFTSGTGNYGDLRAVLFDDDFDTLWTVRGGGDNYDNPGGALVLSDGNYLMTADLSLEDTTNNNYSLSRGRQVYLIKISSGGEILWTNSYGTTLDEKVMDVMELSDGNILICGFREENYVYLFDKPAAWLKKIDSEGNELWTVEFERYYPAQIGEDSAGDIYLAASEMTDTDSYYSYYNHTDARLVKLTSGGTVLWNKLLEP